jgi:NADH-quinone oxidoreductase subunit H
MSEFFQQYQHIITPILQIAVVVGAMMLFVMYLVLWERKLIAFMQVRLGPMRVGYVGLLQPIADVVKLLLKEDISPSKADRLVHLFAPVILMIPALACFAVIPFSGSEFEVFGFSFPLWIADVNIGILYFFALSSLGVYGIVMGGWSSNSKYSMLGAMRSAAQMISYEVPLGLSIVAILMLSGTASMVEIVRTQEQSGYWFLFWNQACYPQIIALFLYFVSAVAETNRHPFDLPEAENELVAGFHTEYSGMKFAFMFLAEYLNMILVGCIVTVLFLGGWLPVTFGIPGLKHWFSLEFAGGNWEALAGVFWFMLKVVLVLNVYLWIRATFPRYRYDQLMRLAWRWLIPLALVHVMVTALAMLLAR